MYLNYDELPEWRKDNEYIEGVFKFSGQNLDKEDSINENLVTDLRSFLYFTTIA